MTRYDIAHEEYLAYHEMNAPADCDCRECSERKAYVNEQACRFELAKYDIKESTMDKTFEEIAADEMGTIYIDKSEDGIRFVVLRGLSSLCAYMGIPLSHPLAGHDYDDLPVDCHYGLTYAGEGVTGLEDSGLYWYGWDYAHSGDCAFFDLELGTGRSDAKRWTPAAVDNEAWITLSQFKSLMTLAETIAGQAPKGEPDAR